jgi:signal transduction histidine kinase
VPPIASISSHRDRDDARLSAAVTEAVEAERARTRAWLHDTLLQTLEFLASGGYADRPDAGSLMRIAAGAAGDLRAYVEDAAPEAAGSLVERLHGVVADEQLLAGHEIRLVFGDVDGSVDGEEAAELVAAVREALTNVRKHAQAAEAVVVCHVSEGHATVVVEDDGIGFNPHAVRRGAGLRHSIVGRLGRYGGSATIDSDPGRGTRITLRMHVTTFDIAEGLAA